MSEDTASPPVPVTGTQGLPAPHPMDEAGTEISQFEIDWLALKSLYKEAEAALHEAELIHGDLAIPSVNQLRYAGHHIVSIHTSATASEADEEYRRALRHCKRAIFDAYDSVIVFLLGSIQLFQRDYRQVQIAPIFKDYPDVLSKAREAQKFLKTMRALQDNRDEFYRECRRVANELLELSERMEDAREELNKSIKEHDTKVMLGWGGLALGAGMFAVAVLTLGVRLLGL